MIEITEGPIGNYSVFINGSIIETQMSKYFFGSRNGDIPPLFELSFPNEKDSRQLTQLPCSSLPDSIGRLSFTGCFRVSDFSVDIDIDSNSEGAGAKPLNVATIVKVRADINLNLLAWKNPWSIVDYVELFKSILKYYKHN
ncbi:MAG: hypothetical protein EOO89_21560 [Pedobacter sp.]|nr:MAG: hypothetical protein EOO89_21560 [Pedobacter sp.]